jgi:hypothetical protein
MARKQAPPSLYSKRWLSSFGQGYGSDRGVLGFFHSPRFVMFYKYK